MFKFILMLFFILHSTSSYGNDLTFISNGSPSGTNGQQLMLFKNIFEENSIKTDIKLTNQNCALAKLNWDKSSKSTLMMINHGADGLTDPENKACFMKIKKEHILFWVYSTPYTFCSAKDRVWNDFIKSNSEHVIVIPTEKRIVDFFDDLSKRYNNRLKLVKVLNSSIALSMAKSGEVDFVFRTGISEFDHFKNKCIWSTIPTSNIDGIEKFIENAQFYNFTTDTYIIGKNIDKKQIVNLLKITWNSSEMKKLHQKRGYDNSLVDYSNDIEYINIMNILYSKIF